MQVGCSLATGTVAWPGKSCATGCIHLTFQSCSSIITGLPTLPPPVRSLWTRPPTLPQPAARVQHRLCGLESTAGWGRCVAQQHILHELLCANARVAWRQPSAVRTWTRTKPLTLRSVPSCLPLCFSTSCTCMASKAGCGTTQLVRSGPTGQAPACIDKQRSTPLLNTQDNSTHRLQSSLPRPP